MTKELSHQGQVLGDAVKVAPPFPLMDLPDGCLLEVLRQARPWSLRAVNTRFRTSVESTQTALRLRQVPPLPEQLLRLFHRLPNLLELNFSDASFSKLHPLDPPAGADLRVLDGCLALTSLNLYVSRVVDIAPLTALLSLRTLALTLVTDITPIASCSALTSVDLSRCPELRQLSPLLRLPAVTSLRACLPQGTEALEALPHSLASLHLEVAETVVDISALAACTRLTALSLNSCIGVTDVSALWTCGGRLLILDLSTFISVPDVAPLAACTSLLSLSLACHRVVGGVGALASCTRLETLTLTKCHAGMDLSPLAVCPLLWSVAIVTCHDVDVRPLTACAQLASLCIADSLRMCVLPSPPQITSLHFSLANLICDLGPLPACCGLRSLDLHGTQRRVEYSGHSHNNTCRINLSPLATCAHLTHLAFMGFSRVRSFQPLSALTNLVSLDLSHNYPTTHNLGFLTALVHLTDVSLGDWGALQDLSPLACCTQLSRLDLCGCRALADVRPLALCPQLAWLSVKDTAVVDVTPLLACKQLCFLDAVGCQSQGQGSAAGLCKELRRLFVLTCQRCAGAARRTHCVLRTVSMCMCTRVT